jgi:hypothetical protein
MGLSQSPKTLKKKDARISGKELPLIAIDLRG